MGDALRTLVVRLATDPDAYYQLLVDPRRVLASVSEAERRALLSGDAAALASALAASPPPRPLAAPGWPPCFVWSAVGPPLPCPAMPWAALLPPFVWPAPAHPGGSPAR